MDLRAPGHVGSCIALALSAWLGFGSAAPSRALAEGESDDAKARECFETAAAAYAAGRLSEAAEGFRCAYERVPSAELAWNLGRVYERLGEGPLALRYYRLYLASNKASAAERRELDKRTELLAEQRKRGERALKPPPISGTELSERARELFTRGVQLYRGRRYEAAHAAFTAALAFSEAPELRFNLGAAAERLRRPQEAAEHYEAYLTARPSALDRSEVQARITQLRSNAR